MITYIDLIGYFGGTIGSIRLVPQIVKSIKTKSTEDISYGMLGMSITSQVCTIVYTAHINAMPLLVPVTLSFFSTLVMTGVKYAFDNRSTVQDSIEIELESLVNLDIL